MPTTTAPPTSCACTTIPDPSSASSGCSPSDRALLEAYRATTWSVRCAGRSLRLAVGSPAPPGIGEVAVVTACNPASHRTRPEDNRAASRALRRRLDALGLAWMPARAHGTGPHARSWDEPGFALIGRAAGAAVRLGQEFGQNAVLVARPGAPGRLVSARAGFCGRQPGEPLDL